MRVHYRFDSDGCLDRAWDPESGQMPASQGAWASRPHLGKVDWYPLLPLWRRAPAIPHREGSHEHRAGAPRLQAGKSFPLRLHRGARGRQGTRFGRRCLLGCPRRAQRGQPGVGASVPTSSPCAGHARGEGIARTGYPEQSAVGVTATRERRGRSFRTSLDRLPDDRIGEFLRRVSVPAVSRRSGFDSPAADQPTGQP